MFHFPGSAPHSRAVSRSSLERFPHSVTLGSPRAPPLPEAFRGVPRPSSPPQSQGIPRVLPWTSSSEVVKVPWWAEVDLNHRPPAYQAGALTPAPSAPPSVLRNHIVAGPRPPRAAPLALPLPRKEVIQPHLPIRLPCYDFTPITDPTVDGRLRGPGFGCGRLSWCDGRCVQGPGTDSPRHADPRLLAIPASCRRVAACNPNYDALSGVRSRSRGRLPLSAPL